MSSVALAAKTLDQRPAMGRGAQGLVLAYFLLKPFYFWESGLPQIADGILVLLMVQTWAASRREARLPGSLFQKSLIMFVYWTVVVNSAAAIVWGESAGQFLLASFFNIYNLFAALTVLYYARASRRQLLTAAYYGSLGSLLLQGFIILLPGLEGSLRATGGFNNPNQLAIFAVLCVGILVVGHSAIGPLPLLTVIGIWVGMVSIALSMSRAGIFAAVVLLLGILLWSQGRVQSGRTQFRVLAVLPVPILLLVLLKPDALVGNAWLRILIARTAAGDGDRFQAIRGYDRVVDFPQYWLQGAGEGAFERFSSTLEVHSTLANIQVSYGIVGTLLFGLAVFASMRPAGIRVSYVVVAPLVYGVAHNGIRNTVFWVLLAMLAATSEESDGDRTGPHTGTASPSTADAS